MIFTARAEKGKTLETATADALALAKRMQCSVEFPFGGATVRVKPDDTPQKAAARAEAAMRIRRETVPHEDLEQMKRGGVK